MDALAAAEATAPAVSKLASHFMLDGQTYKRGGELGFAGLDFYIAGRGGVLGQVDADVVAAAFAFFEPGHVRTQWETGLAVMPAADAAAAFASCGYAWAESHLPDDLDAARLAELAGSVAEGARLACAPVFAGWRRLPVPQTPKAAALHHMNALRELRHGLHAACVVAAGISPLEALSVNQPSMAPIFGWTELADTDGAEQRWHGAEAATNTAIAHAYIGLTDAERAEFSELCAAVHAATIG
jgi:hypothetical protein